MKISGKKRRLGHENIKPYSFTCTLDSRITASSKQKQGGMFPMVCRYSPRPYHLVTVNSASLESAFSDSHLVNSSCNLLLISGTLSLVMTPRLFLFSVVTGSPICQK
ncbi:hypothetical protein E2C01_000566 [Portunus trituberculatus]|uniref:Uncharacterized protein n=1 Tax=Portunus trituberculatus TaxID=210409 RepID=A0A5B7CF15_PORTR|nr:hypothetical protein [Portunus trituberculatus]